MVRASKTVVAATPAPAPVSAAPAKEAAPKKTAAKKATKVVDVPVVANTEVVADAPLSNEVVAAESTESTIVVKMNEFSAKFQQVLSLLSTLKADYKTLEKSVAREIKTAQKTTQKKKRSGNRQPSGFVKPTRISDELASFLGKPAGTELARTAVSKEINAYIRANNLQDKDNGRKIIPDAKLTALLKIQDSDELTYFNLQRFMKHHFVKAEVVATA
jgi:chromatin remodeling complex protein RSC6